MIKRVLPEEVLTYFRAQGARGGTTASRSMTAAQRKARAVKAGRASAAARAKKARKAIDYSDITASTHQQLTSMRRVGARIDLSDMPELSDAQLASMRRRRRTKKKTPQKKAQD